MKRWKIPLLYCLGAALGSVFNLLRHNRSNFNGRTLCYWTLLGIAFCLLERYLRRRTHERELSVTAFKRWGSQAEPKKSLVHTDLPREVVRIQRTSAIQSVPSRASPMIPVSTT